MRANTGRYSGYIRPFSYALDLIIINFLAYIFLLDSLNEIYYHIFISISWIIIAWNIGFYEVYRFTNAIEILSKSFKQYIFFLIINFSYLGIFLALSAPTQMLKFVTLAIVFISIFKFSLYYLLRRFRVVFGGNFRRVVIVGHGKDMNELAEFFNKNLDYGYKLVKVFDTKVAKKEQLENCQNKVGPGKRGE